MDWTDVLPQWGVAALAVAVMAFAAVVVFALARKGWRVKELEVSLPLLFKAKAAREETPQAKKDEKPATPPRQSRTIQEAKATNGAKADVEQNAPRNTPTTQKAVADGQDTELKVKQTVH